MALNGFALGGFAQGFNQQQQLQLSQQSADRTYELGQQGLALQAQAQKNAEQRAMMARADSARSDMLKLVSDTVTAMKQSGVDNATISRQIQSIVQPLKRLTKSSGLDDSMVDASVAAMLARPATDISSLTGGSPSAPAQSTPQPTQPAPQASAMSPAAPSTFDQRFAGASPTAMAPQTDAGTTVNGGIPNLSSPGVTVGQPVAAPVTNDPNAEVQRFTLALARLPADANPNVRTAIAVRLQDAVQRARQNDNIEVKTVKDENQNEHIVFVDKRNRTITDQNGQPYVTPTGGDSDANAIADAIKQGKQPPVLTGLYKNAKAVRAALARQDVDLSRMQLEWDAARKQVASLNGPQMVKYKGLADSVVNTIDEVRHLSQQLNMSGIPLVNATKLQAFVQTAGNTQEGQLVAKYLAAVGTLKEEFANLANGGYAPTEPAWALANQQINGNYGVNQLDASLTEVQRLIRYRINGIPNFNTLGPAAPNRYTPSGTPQAPGAAPAPSDSGWQIQKVQ